MTEAIDVRDATLEDVDRLLELQLELRSHHRELEPDNPRYQVGTDEWRALIQNALQGDNSHILVATTSDTTSGFVQLTFVEKPWGIGCEMDTVVVAEQQRGSGVGKCLVEAAEKYARDAGAKGMRANVLAANTRGQAFYERAGYETIAVRMGKCL